MFSVSFSETSPKASLSHGILTPVFRFRFYFIRRCTHFSTYELAVSSDFRVQFKYLKDNDRFYSLRYIRFGMILSQSNLWKFWRKRKFDFIRRARQKKSMNREVTEPARVNYGWNYWFSNVQHKSRSLIVFMISKCYLNWFRVLK